jgi:dethiobiotin synthetase
MKQILFITGTDTGVGKTVLTALLTRFLRERGIKAAALKPICSGGRDDARALHVAMNGALMLDEINPWHFRAAIAPLLAARREKRSVTRPQVLAHIRAVKKKFDMLLVEGAGGLLSPLGEGFNSRDLISALSATPVIVAPNRLGVVNHILLTLEALPDKSSRRKAKIVLMSPPKPDAASRTNHALLAEFIDPIQIISLPWLGENFDARTALKKLQVQQTLCALVNKIG